MNRIDGHTTKSSVAAAIDAAKDVVDPLDDLVQKSVTDLGAPFTEEALHFLRTIKSQDRAAFENARGKFKKHGIRVGELDKALARHHSEEGVTTGSSALVWAEDKPSRNPVSGEILLDSIVSEIRRYLVLPDLAAESIALWVTAMHCLNNWSVSPRLAFVSPEKRCGKTTALSVIQNLVLRPLPASNITSAAVFRAIDKASPTLLIDEADTFLPDNDELRGVLNSGHHRAQAYVVRTVGDNHEPTRFCTWAPVVIAMIGELPDTLQDRSISIHLKRKTTMDKVERFRIDKVEHFIELRSKIIRWIKDAQRQLIQWDGSVPLGLHDRAADNWRPLLAIADTASGKWPELARKAALSLTGSDEESSDSVLLLRDIHNLFLTLGNDRLSTHQILGLLHDMDNRPWPEWRQSKPITARQLAQQLKPFGVSSAATRFPNGENVKGYMKYSFNDAFSRYITSASVTASQPNKTGPFSENCAVTQKKPVTDNNELKHQQNDPCDAVTTKNRDEGRRYHEMPDLPHFLHRSNQRGVMQ